MKVRLKYIIFMDHFNQFTMLQSDDDIKQHSKAVVSIRYSENGRFVASASADKKVNIIDSETGNVVKSLEGEHAYGINDCAWISENLLASGADDQTVKVWDVEQGVVLANFKLKTFCYSLAVNPINRTILSGGYDGSISIFHLSARDSLLTFNGHSEPIVSISVDAQGEHYATAAQDGLIRLWANAAQSTCLRTIIGTEKQSHPMSSVCYSPNSHFVLASSLDSTHRLFSTGLYDNSLGTGTWGKSEVIRSYSGHTNNRYSIFSALYSNDNGNYVISGSEDNKIYLWNVDDSTIVATGEGHQGVVMAIAGNPDPSKYQLASGCSDGTVKLWNIKNNIE